MGQPISYLTYLIDGLGCSRDEIALVAGIGVACFKFEVFATVVHDLLVLFLVQ